MEVSVAFALCIILIHSAYPKQSMMYVFVPIRPCLHTLFWRKLPLSEAWGLNTGDEQCCLSLGASPRRELNTQTSQLVTNALNTDAEGDVLHKSRFCLYIWKQSRAPSTASYYRAKNATSEWEMKWVTSCVCCVKKKVINLKNDIKERMKEQ